MAKPTLCASVSGKEKANDAFKRSGKTQEYIAGKAGTTRQRIAAFLEGRNVDKQIFIAICEALNLDWQEISGITQLLSPSNEIEVSRKDSTQSKQIGADNIYAGGNVHLTIHQTIASESAKPSELTSTPNINLEELVKLVRSRLHDDIQRLHGTMPLWGVDHWANLGELFVDVNILEELSSSRRLEMDELWQDFSQNPNYCSLDRIGLGKERERVSGLEALTKNTNLTVVGKPGSGKTTYLQRIVTDCNAGNIQAHRIPVLIKLREFVDDGREVTYSLERYLEGYWRLSSVETQLVLNQGRALVLLDGLDEVTGKEGETITKGIQKFARDYPQVQVVMTCRIQSQESRFDRFNYVEVADFNEAQVRLFAKHWFRTLMGNDLVGLAQAQEFLGLLFLEPTFRS